MGRRGLIHPSSWPVATRARREPIEADSARVPEKSVPMNWPELVCPFDHLPFESADDALRCPSGHEFPVRDGIARLLETDANYADAFGVQWNTYLKTQLDSYTGLPLSLDRARRCIGSECWERLNNGPLHVLEVGCGAGRFTEVLCQTGSPVTSLDYSSAVEANQKNFPQDEKHRIVQGDVLALPFAGQQFDVVFCLGVIQHTPSPERTMAKLYEQVKPGGFLVIDHYKYQLSYFTKTSPLFRMVLKRLPAGKSMKYTEWLVKLFFPFHKAARHSHPMQMLVSRVSPVLSYYHVHKDLSDQLQYEWALLDTHDSLTDWYKHFRTVDQIRQTLEQLGGQEIHCQYGGNGVEARCRRPG